MDYDHLSPTGSRSPLTSSNSPRPDPNPTPREPSDYNTLRPQRACEYCRQHKVRCDVDPQDPSRPCGRCLKANRNCTSSPNPRRRRKTTDSRVLELERRVEKLSSRLQALEQRSDNNEPVLAGGKSSSSEAPLPPLLVPPSEPPDAKKDVIDLGIIGVELAGRIFHHYVMNIASIFPAVVFPPDTASSDIRWKRPTLFLAILTTGSATFDTSLQRKLHSELMKSYSHQVVHRGMKSLDLVQALTLSAMWAYSPEYTSDGNITQFMNMAAVMAGDIGITRSGKALQRNPKSDASVKLSQVLGETHPIASAWKHIIWGVNSDAALPECRRALLSCYFCCTNMARFTHRNNVLLFTPYVAECVKFFESSNEPGILSSDRIFVQWVKIARIAEEFGVALGLDGTEKEVSALEVRRDILERFLGRTTSWRKESLDAGLITPALDLYYQSITKYMYDSVLDSLDDPEPMFGRPATRPQRQLNPSQAKFYNDTARVYLASVHSCLDGFLAFSPAYASSLPGFIYLEAVFALYPLLKMLIGVVLKPTDCIYRMDELNISDYLERYINFVTTVARDHKRITAERQRSMVLTMKSIVDRIIKKIESDKRPVPSFGQSAAAATASTLPTPVPMSLTYMPSPQVGEDTIPMSFDNYPNVNRNEGGLAVPNMDADFDPMVWNNFQFTDLFQFGGVPDSYTPWG